MRVLKLCLLCAVCVLSIKTVNAQLVVSADVNPQFAMDGYKTGIGANVGFGLENVGVRLGYSSFKAKDMDVTASIIPLTAYYNYFMGKGKLRFLITGDIGAFYQKMSGSFSITTSYSAVSTKPSSAGQKYYVTNTNTTDISSSKVYFGGDAGIGVDYKLTAKISLFSCVKMNYILSDPSTSWVGVNVGARYFLPQKRK